MTIMHRCMLLRLEKVVLVDPAGITTKRTGQRIAGRLGRRKLSSPARSAVRSSSGIVSVSDMVSVGCRRAPLRPESLLKGRIDRRGLPYDARVVSPRTPEVGRPAGAGCRVRSELDRVLAEEIWWAVSVISSHPKK